MLRNIGWILVLFIVAAPLLRADNGAMLYIKGQARVNGGSIPSSSAVFSGDIVQTDTDSEANINALGSNIVLTPGTVLVLEDNGVNLDRGGITVVTARGATVHTGSITVMPAHSSSTQYEISNSGGTIHVVARKGDLTVSDASGSTQVNEGQETTRTDTQSKRKDGAMAGGKGPLIPAVVYEAAAAGGVGAFIVYELSQDRTPASPIKP